MKRSILAVLGFFFIAVASARAETSFSAGVNVGNSPDHVVFADPPEFIAPPSMGFYIAVGVPYDMFYARSHYYMFRNNIWYRASNYNGPWIVYEYRRLPTVLRKHRYEDIVRMRDREYHLYQSDRQHYHGRQYHPKKAEITKGHQRQNPIR
jgi:hypothetical protein